MSASGTADYRTPPVTYDVAERLICEVYPDGLADADPEWWRDMVEILMEFESVETARRWLRNPSAKDGTVTG